MLRTADGYLIGTECCEELWAPIPSSNGLFLQGAQILLNLSGSHFHLRKLSKREDLIKSVTSKTGGVYLYSNQRGCDGNRLYFDGASMITVNGRIVGIGKQFQLKDVEVLSAVIDLSEVETYRSPANARALQANDTINRSYPVIDVKGFHLLLKKHKHPSVPQKLNMPCTEEQVAFAPACWLWDFLRRSGARGFLVPVSGSADSAASLAICGVMCGLVLDEYSAMDVYNKAIMKRDIKYLTGGTIPSTPQEFAREILHTAFIGTRALPTILRDRTRKLAEEIGSSFYNVDIEQIALTAARVAGAFLKCGELNTMQSGGTHEEEYAVQGLYERSKMVMSYLLGQLLPAQTGKTGVFLVVGSGNIEEGLLGYNIKYDTSSADLNPIGGIAKTDLGQFLYWAAEHRGYHTCVEIAKDSPMSEIKPLFRESKNGPVAMDTSLSYSEIDQIARYRKSRHMGPYFTYKKIREHWSGMGPEIIAGKIKNFYRRYGRNRHKLPVLTPALHVENYSADDNRFDMRPILYNYNWDAQFAAIDEHVQAAPNSSSH